MQTIATTFGILGTFIGIIVALYNFDTSNIELAVPSLLDGLKFSFVTSIVGMVTSLLIGLFPQKFGHGIGSEDGVVEDKDKSEPELLAELLSEMKTLNGNISGESDTTLITQIQKLRTSINDKQDELKKSFDDFAKQMADNNVNALIEAVQKVMEDFNAKINDQLGENFKRLSEATENLVVWQDKYRDQLATSADAITKSSEVLNVSSESINKLTERAKDFDNISTQLKESLEVMGSSMTGLKNLADSLDKSGQQIRNEMSEITRENIKDLGENLKGISEELVEDYSYLQKMMQTVINKKDQ
jgi:DNA anti-recombination protein RmuC